jgi:hypothetical protein
MYEYVARARARLQAGLAPRTPTQRAEEMLRRLVDRRERAARVRRVTTQAERYARLCRLDDELCDLIDSYTASLDAADFDRIASLRIKARRILSDVNDL